MPVSSEQFYAVMAGSASEDVTAQVIAELELIESPLQVQLRRVAVLAQTQIPSVPATSDFLPYYELTQEVHIRPTRDSALNKLKTERSRRVGIVEDFQDFREGIATEQVTILIVEALTDPNSKLHALLRSITLKRE